MGRHLRDVLLSSFLIGATIVVPTMAHAGEGDLCKKDGYTQWTTHVGGDAFNNQGQCVSFVARHGVLVSITAPESPPPPVDGGGSVGGDEPPPEDPPVEELPDN